MPQQHHTQLLMMQKDMVVGFTYRDLKKKFATTFADFEEGIESLLFYSLSFQDSPLMNIAATATDTSPQTKGKFLLAPIQLLCLSLQYSIRITKVFRYMPIEPQTFFKLIEFLMALERYLA